MCGIVGMVSSTPFNVCESARKALEALEYRGYDSFGIMGDDFSPRKYMGPVSRAGTVGSMYGRSGIAHTRWATHGAVNISNTHPHLSTMENTL